MTVPSVALDETKPAGTRAKSLGDDDIREFKTQVREILDVDHKYDSSGQAATMGKHNKVSLIEAADLGTGAEGLPILGAQTVSGKGELVYTDEDDNDVEITSGGSIKAESIDGVYPASVAAKTVNILGLVYPVGCVYMSTVSTNPNTLFGFGTWEAWGAGKAVVGLDSGDTDFDAAEETGGTKTHTLTTDEIPAHTHTWTNRKTGAGQAGMDTAGNYDNLSANTGSTGGGSAHNNLSPYIVAYLFKRTA